MQRSTFAIVFTDAVKSTELMNSDEERVVETVMSDLERFGQICTGNGGNVVKNRGDGLLVTFPSAVQAVRSAIAMQQQCRSALLRCDKKYLVFHRIGIHFGDVVMSENDILGDAVNLAARLEPKAPPGGICISDTVHQLAANTLKYKARGNPPMALKGIATPVKTWTLTPNPHADQIAVEQGWDYEHVKPSDDLARVREAVSVQRARAQTFNLRMQAWMWGGLAVACIGVGGAFAYPYISSAVVDFTNPRKPLPPKVEARTVGGGATAKKNPPKKRASTQSGAASYAIHERSGAAQRVERPAAPKPVAPDASEYSDLLRACIADKDFAGYRKQLEERGWHRFRIAQTYLAHARVAQGLVEYLDSRLSMADESNPVIVEPPDEDGSGGLAYCVDGGILKEISGGAATETSYGDIGAEATDKLLRAVARKYGGSGIAAKSKVLKLYFDELFGNS